MWQQALDFAKQRPLAVAVGLVALFFASPAIALTLLVLSPILAPAAILAAVRGRPTMD